jgi:hypothetical protein
MYINQEVILTSDIAESDLGRPDTAFGRPKTDLAYNLFSGNNKKAARKGGFVFEIGSYQV